MSQVTIEKAERGYLLRAKCFVRRPLEEVFAFFSSAANLERLTPPWVRFQVLTPQPIVMRAGLMIDYQLRIQGIPIRWRSEIVEWQPRRFFVDEQRRGPYSFWRHEHRFEEGADGTWVLDQVRYGVPGGALIHQLIVRRQVKRIFEFRHQALEEIFA